MTWVPMPNTAAAAVSAGGLERHFRESTSLHIMAFPPAPAPLQEAWNAIQKKHPDLPVMFFAADEEKALAYAGVPQGLTSKIAAGELCTSLWWGRGGRRRDGRCKRDARGHVRGVWGSGLCGISFCPPPRPSPGRPGRAGRAGKGRLAGLF